MKRQWGYALPDTPTFRGYRATLKISYKVLLNSDSCEHGGRAFQNLPRHMQRRAVSSNPKRLPRYLQERHKKEGGANVKPTHRPRRKYRRRPCNLLAEYNRRQKEFIWLETHIWHAKRFHMKRQWGYALPDTPTFKGYRATLRAATKSCLIQDVSYLCCIELEGPKKPVIAGMSRMIEPTSLAALTDSQFQFGQKWISVTLFQPGRQPYGAVGDADILWHPPSSFTSETKSEATKVWIWVHPSAHNQVLEGLVEVFQLVKIQNRSKIMSGKMFDTSRLGEEDAEVSSNDRDKCNVPENSEEEVRLQQDLHGTEVIRGCIETKHLQNEEIQKSTDHACDDLGQEKNKMEKDGVDNVHQLKINKHENVRNVNAVKLEMKNIPFERTPKYANTSNFITVTLLKDTLNRFKLTGPKSYAVLMAALNPAKVTTTAEESLSSSCDESQYLNQPWWKQYYHSTESVLCHQQQVDTWKKIASSPLLPRVILPLTVRDPRVTLPRKKVPILAVKPDTGEKLEHSDWPGDSPLYDSDLRDVITQSKEPDAVINKRRSQLLVPGSKLPENQDEARVPVLLLSRPLTSSAGHGSGWDVIVAAGWGMSVWMSLVFCGGAAGGQQESENLHLETYTPLPPHLMPDTLAGSYYSRWLAEKRHTQFFKRPPAKRHNYIKLGVQYPFCPPWRKLLQDWEPGAQDIFVLRDVKLLNSLAQLIENFVTKSVQKSAQKRKANEQDKVSGKKLRTDRLRKNIHDFEAYSEKDSESKGLPGEDSSFESHADSLQTDELYQKLTFEELLKLNHGCLVMVKLTLLHKGTVEPCAMICLPEEEDFKAKEMITKPNDISDGLLEPTHADTQSTQRVKLKEEHAKIKGRIRRLRRKARLKVATDTDIQSAALSDQNIEKATAHALEKVKEENEVILTKYSSFKDEMEVAWLMKTDEPLQCCSRKIMGYITLGNFCQALGKGAGIGWVALRSLHFLHMFRKKYDEHTGSTTESQEFEESKWKYSVLVRNPSNLQYRWAKLSLVVQAK
ncbi:ribonucleases P/MRP protein subunit POP1 isoform X2 [Panulirus ornatus]|uniref:ribonucleases P/MRP protein subunit POP1 isoform X2 n=1 Tax=Panulirus ornatus TaxID=150431 RepID=UPI003A881778